MSTETPKQEREQLKAGESGRLHVSLKSRSNYFQNNALISVRDSTLSLVHRVRNGAELDLTPGIYQVSAVMDNGVEQAELVRVSGGAMARIELKGPDLSNAPEWAQSRGPANPAPQYPPTQGGAAEPAPAPAPVGASPEAEVAEAGATLIAETGEWREQGNDTWTFEPNSRPKSVHTARIEWRDVAFRVSLPVSMESGALNTCDLQLDTSSSRPIVRVSISPRRTVAFALERMLLSGELASAMDMASDGTRALVDKYSDPTGAVLGGVILDKAGVLSERIDWLRNLERSFPWLADGKVLLAKALVQEHGCTEEALSLAIAASEQTLLLTEVYSMLLDMLRRWPSEERIRRSLSAANRLAEIAPDLDWSSIYLCRRLEK